MMLTVLNKDGSEIVGYVAWSCVDGHAQYRVVAPDSMIHASLIGLLKTCDACSGGYGHGQPSAYELQNMVKLLNDVGYHAQVFDNGDAP